MFYKGSEKNNCLKYYKVQERPCSHSSDINYIKQKPANKPKQNLLYCLLGLCYKKNNLTIVEAVPITKMNDIIS